jgi:hypothetical protein
MRLVVDQNMHTGDVLLRADVAVEDTWDLSQIFASDQAWETDWCRRSSGTGDG